jgi:hypothetical protein
MQKIQVAVVNNSSLSSQDVEEGVAALQAQVRQDFAPVWNVDADLSIIQPGTRSPGHWGLVLLDSRAYPEITTSGLPLAQVRVEAVGHGEDWTHLASHELLEMLVDPMLAGTVYRQVEGDAAADRPTCSLYARQVCDPCAAYANSYRRGIEGRQRPVSDFVFPSWFRAADPAGERPGRLDERSLAGAPFEVLEGGYAFVLDLVARTLVAVGQDGHAVAPQPPMSSPMQHLADALNGLPKPSRAEEAMWSP